jgi:hypothetical protein
MCPPYVHSTPTHKEAHTTSMSTILHGSFNETQLTANTLVPSSSGITFLCRSCMCGSLSGNFAVSSKVLLWSVKELSSCAEVCLQNGQGKQFMK